MLAHSLAAASDAVTLKVPKVAKVSELVELATAASVSASSGCGDAAGRMAAALHKLNDTLSVGVSGASEHQEHAYASVQALLAAYSRPSSSLPVLSTEQQLLQAEFFAAGSELTACVHSSAGSTAANASATAGETVCDVLGGATSGETVRYDDWLKSQSESGSASESER